MKTILLIKDKKPFWKDITEYLRKVNAKIHNLEETNANPNFREKPDLIIIGGDGFKKLPAETQEVPKMVVLNGTIPEKAPNNAFFAVLPLSEEAFLETTSRLLYISERRLFKTVISVTHKGKDKTYLGRSMNFSMSGMAFKVDEILITGDALTMGFFIPGTEKRLSVEAEVMRSSIDPEDNAFYYGAKFTTIDDETKTALEGFIRNIRARKIKQ
jgi:hypothetical protein